MISHLDSTHLCQLTAAQIQEILVLNGVLIQQYQPELHRWLTIAQLPDLGQLTLNLEPEKADEIDRRLQNREIVEFTAMTTVMNINICDRYVFVPLLEQPDFSNSERIELWGRICLRGNLNSVWTAQDLSWVQALGQQLLAAMSMGVNPSTDLVVRSKSSPLTDLAELIERIDRLETLCQQKDDFINNISHDLRAPLLNIKMGIRMLTTSLRTDPEVADLLSGHRAEKYLNIVEQECDRELELINNILELQRIELSLISGQSSNRDRANLESIELATWLPTTIEPFLHRASNHRQTIITSMSDPLPAITTDRHSLTKILTELLNNACKYTYLDGQILVEIDGNIASNWLTIIIRNQAEILPQHLPHIFDRFYRIPGSDRQKQGGSGLGLSLVQQLVRHLNGEIEVASSGGWTEFEIKLPVVNDRN